MKRGMGDGDVILKKKEELTSEEKLGAGPGEKPEKRSTENTRKKTAADKSDTAGSAVKKPKRRSSADKTDTGKGTAKRSAKKSTEGMPEAKDKPKTAKNKSADKKPAGKKPAGKKPAGKKSEAKKSEAKKSEPKKSDTKKSDAKKPPEKKTVTKRSGTKKSVSKKAASERMADEKAEAVVLVGNAERNGAAEIDSAAASVGAAEPINAGEAVGNAESDDATASVAEIAPPAEIASGDVRDSVGVGGSEREIHAGGDNAAFRAEESLRAALLGLLGSPDYTPIRRGELCELMAPDDERTAGAVLDRLIAEGEAVVGVRGRIMSLSRAGCVRGRFRANARGFGFVTPEEGLGDGSDIYIPADETAYAVDGDTVVVRMHADRDRRERRCEGEVIRIVAHSVTAVTGTVIPVPPEYPVTSETGLCVRPDDPSYNFIVLIDAGNDTVPHAGSCVSAVITDYPDHTGTACGVIERVFGESGTPDAVYASVYYEYGVPLGPNGAFDGELLAEAERISEEGIHYGADGVHGGDIDGRLDLRGETVFTLDGADAKDLDDAISISRDGDGYILGVHIADVSHYVRPGSELDREAMRRGTSVYVTDRVVPMLPRPISNGICSLTAGVDRLTVSAIMHIDAQGRTVRSELHRSVIHSRLRGVYGELNDVIARGAESEYAEKYSVLGESLTCAQELYSILLDASGRRGALDMETDEARIILDENGAPRDIVLVERGTAERMIEQFMLAANEAVAQTLRTAGMPCVYRIHEDPSPEKMQAFSVFAHNLGLDITPLRGDRVTPAALSAVLAEAERRGIGSVVSVVLLRSLMKARYSTECTGHFGLALDNYCHFTSPIRRYPDLCVHRFIGMLADGANATEIAAAKRFAEQAAESSNESELRAVGLERAIDDLYKAMYMSGREGEEFDGVVSSVTSFGMFVSLPNTVEGLVPISSLDGFFVFDERALTLSGNRTVYRLGTPVRVRLTRSDIVRRRIDFVLVGGGDRSESGDGDRIARGRGGAAPSAGRHASDGRGRKGGRGRARGNRASAQLKRAAKAAQKRRGSRGGKGKGGKKSGGRRR